MSDCQCHAGKICDLHVEEVMGNLNDRLKGRTNYHDSEDGLMSPNSIDDCGCTTGYMCSVHRRPIYPIKTSGGSVQGGIVGGHLGSPTPEQIDHDIIGELVLLRQRVADMETAKDFHMACIENLVERLNEAEDKLKAIEQQFLEILSHGCCIPVCSKHQGPVEIRGNG